MHTSPCATVRDAYLNEIHTARAELAQGIVGMKWRHRGTLTGTPVCVLLSYINLLFSSIPSANQCINNNVLHQQSAVIHGAA
ncbi:hypothetical protein J6590_046526 [Homalodisca vitripennis]|nr:hypothetical protein J6590_046526 [Homalodisca vitripennis]